MIDALTATDIHGQPQPLARWRGQVLLIVNVASRCGFTPQYQALAALQQRYQAQGFSVLAFPCNQFGGQEPEDEAGILQFCRSTYAVDFPLFAKIEVKGPHAHPLYRWLTRARPGLLGLAAIKWNFTKFLLARDGRVLARYAPTTRPERLRAAIEAALRAACTHHDDSPTLTLEPQP